LSERWREDGFCIAFELCDSDAALDVAMALAEDFGQGAIFRYRRPASLTGQESITTILRDTIPCRASGPSESSITTVEMVRILPPVVSDERISQLLGRPYAGPAAAALVLNRN
jgi:hypothetical protein